METRQAYSLVYSASLFIVLWATALGLGMSFSLPQVFGSLKRAGLMTRAILLNILVIPLITWGLTRVIPIDPQYAIGLLLIGFASGGPLGLKLAQIERGDLPYAISLVVVLEALNVIVIPFWAGLLMPAGVTINPLQVVATLIVYILIPLGIGWIIKARLAERAKVWVPGANKLSTVALLVVVALAIYGNLNTILSLLGSFTLIIALIILIVSLTLGYALGGPGQATRRVTATATAVRATAPALLIAGQAFATEPQVMAAVIGFGLLATIIPLGAATLMGRAEKRDRPTLGYTSLSSE
jgi:BASS family bile acid:Na+ symporter